MNTTPAAMPGSDRLPDHEQSESGQPRPVAGQPIPRHSAISMTPSWSEIEGAAGPDAPQYAPRKNKVEQFDLQGLPPLSRRHVDELRPHQSYIKHQLFVSADRLAALAEAGDIVFRLPITVTASGIIIDGYARWELARRQGRETIICLEHDLNEEEALRLLIQMHSPSKGLNSFYRSLLASDLEPSLQELARANQRTGGQKKCSSNLTEAQKMDVRSEIAAIANVSTGNLTKAKRIFDSAVPDIQRATRAGEISVHRAWQWSKESPEKQLTKLEEHRSNKGTQLVSRRCIQRHVAKMAPTRLFQLSLGALLKPLIPNELAVLDSIVTSEIDAPGQIAYFSKGAMRLLRSTEEPGCKTAIC